jgi:hypothetical protein
MRTFRVLGLLLLLPAAMAQAETRLTWTCTAEDGSGAVQTVDLVYAGAEPVPCEAYLHRAGATRRIADYGATRGQCERHVREILASLVSRGFSCDEPPGTTLLGVEAFARGEAPGPDAGAPEAAPDAPAAAAPAEPVGQGDVYFAIISRHASEAEARSAARELRAADRSARPVILSPREAGGSWLLALAAYTDAETAAKAVQYARTSGIGPDAYFWNVPAAGNQARP